MEVKVKADKEKRLKELVRFGQDFKVRSPFSSRLLLV